MSALSLYGPIPFSVQEKILRQAPQLQFIRLCVARGRTVDIEQWRSVTNALIDSKREPLRALHVDFARDDEEMLQLLNNTVSSLDHLETLWLVCHTAAKMNMFESCFEALPLSLQALRLNFSGGYGRSRAVTMTEAQGTVQALAACAHRLKLRQLSLYGFDIEDEYVEGSTAAPFFEAIAAHTHLQVLEIGSTKPYGQFTVTKASACIAFLDMIRQLRRLRKLRCSNFWMRNYAAEDENVPSFYDALSQSRSLLETDYNIGLSREQFADLKKQFAENDLSLRADQLCDLTISLVNLD